MRRFGHLLSEGELVEIERILNFGQDPNTPIIGSGSSGNILFNTPRSPSTQR